MTSGQICAAARTAARNRIVIFLTAVVLIPAAAVVIRLFAASWRWNWRLPLIVAGILTAVFFLFWFVSQLAEFASQERRERLSQFVFPAETWLRGVYSGAILIALAILAGTYREGDRWWVTALPMIFAAMAFFAWPRAIEITETEIRQLLWESSEKGNESIR